LSLQTGLLVGFVRQRGKPKPGSALGETASETDAEIMLVADTFFTGSFHQKPAYFIFFIMRLDGNINMLNSCFIPALENRCRSPPMNP
jgi:hypothetical protein